MGARRGRHIRKNIAASSKPWQPTTRPPAHRAGELHRVEQPRRFLHGLGRGRGRRRRLGGLGGLHRPRLGAARQGGQGDVDRRGAPRSATHIAPLSPFSALARSAGPRRRPTGSHRTSRPTRGSHGSEAPSEIPRPDAPRATPTGANIAYHCASRSPHAALVLGRAESHPGTTHPGAIQPRDGSDLRATRQERRASGPVVYTFALIGPSAGPPARPRAIRPTRGSRAPDPPAGPREPRDRITRTIPHFISAN